MIEYEFERRQREAILRLRKALEEEDKDLTTMQESADPEIEARLAAARLRNSQCFQDGM